MTLSEERTAAVKDAFSLFDKDGKGSLAMTEFGTLIRAVGFNPSEVELAELAKKADPSSSGSVAVDAVLQIVTELESKPTNPEEELNEALRVLDKEENGKVSAVELRHVMCNLGEKLSEEEVNEMLEKVEADAEGNMVYKDLIAVLLSK